MLSFFIYSPNIMSPTNGSGEPEEVIAEEADGQDIDPTKKPEKANEEEQFSPAELRKRKPAEDAGISEEQKQKDRETQKAEYQTAFISASNKFNAAMEEGKTIEEALEGVPVQIANRLRKIAEGNIEVTEPKEEQPDVGLLVAQETMKVRLREKADDKFSLIVESAKLTKAEALAFDEETQRLEGKGLDPLESVELASAKLGYSARKEVQEAEERGLEKGLRAVPKIGASPIKEKENMTESEQYYVDNSPSWLRKPKA